MHSSNNESLFWLYETPSFDIQSKLYELAIRMVQPIPACSARRLVGNLNGWWLTSQLNRQLANVAANLTRDSFTDSLWCCLCSFVPLELANWSLKSLSCAPSAVSRCWSPSDFTCSSSCLDCWASILVLKKVLSSVELTIIFMLIIVRSSSRWPARKHYGELNGWVSVSSNRVGLNLKLELSCNIILNLFGRIFTSELLVVTAFLIYLFWAIVFHCERRQQVVVLSVRFVAHLTTERVANL